MPRPNTKELLLAAATGEYARVQQSLSDFPAGRRADIGWQAPIDDQSRNPRDVATHLHAWHLMALDWCRTGEAGGIPQVPAAGRTWRETPAVNAAIWDRYAATSYADAVDRLHESHQAVLEAITDHTEEQLFAKGFYSWTKSTTLGAYFVSATSSHYLWALKTLKAVRRHA